MPVTTRSGATEQRAAAANPTKATGEHSNKAAGSNSRGKPTSQERVGVDVDENSNSPPPLQLLSAGFDFTPLLLHRQQNNNPRTFQPILDPSRSSTNTTDTPRILFTNRKAVALIINSTLVEIHTSDSHHESFARDLDSPLHRTLHHGFGEWEDGGMIGALDGRDGSLYQLYRQDGLGVSVVHFPEVPMRMERIAFAGDGGAAFVVKAPSPPPPPPPHHHPPQQQQQQQSEGKAPGDDGCRIVHCTSFEAFWEWLEEGQGGGISEFVVPSSPPEAGTVKQLVGDGRGEFFLLMEGGEVYGFGGNESSCLTLRRHPSTESSGDDDEASNLGGKKLGVGLVAALSGRGIRKIVCGSQLNAALTKNNTLLTWKTTNLTPERTIQPLRHASVGEVVPMQLPDAEWALDVLDVGVGENHMAVVDEGHRVWVIGDNGGGQLGLDSEEAFFDEWVQVPGLSDVQRVECGLRVTFVFTTDRHT